MALHRTVVEHNADPPEAWQVQKISDRRWALRSAGGGTLDTFSTKREAQDAKVQGRLVDLYAKEGRWFAGLPVTGWKPREDC